MAAGIYEKSSLTRFEILTFDEMAMIEPLMANVPAAKKNTMGQKYEASIVIL